MEIFPGVAIFKSARRSTKVKLYFCFAFHILSVCVLQDILKLPMEFERSGE